MRRHGLGLRWVAGAVVLGAMMVSCGSPGTDQSAGPTATTATTELMISCGAEPFPVSALDHPVGAETGTDPSDQALAAWLADQSPSIGAPLTGWKRLYLDNESAQYTSAGDATGEGVSLTFEHHGNTWQWAGSGGGGCASGGAVFVPGTAETNWSLDPTFPAPKPTDITVHILVDRLACNDGVPVTPDEVHAPAITFTAVSVAVLYVSDPVSPGAHTCPGPMGTPLLLDLAQPVGQRALLDGSAYPPAPVKTTSFP
jgi:hypothetical protein